MTQLEVDGLAIGGAMRVRVDTAGFTDDSDTFLRSRGTIGKIVFGITSQNPPQLWIRTPMIHFEGVLAAGGVDPTDWRGGCLQAITSDYWTGHYADGKEIRYRMNTVGGPLKDGSRNSLFYECSTPLKDYRADPVRVTPLHDSDALQVTFWTEYSGDPFRPNAAGASGNPLVRTSGLCQFRTFLAAVNKSAKAVVTLAECRWSVTFDGEFDHANQQWTPCGNPEMIDYTVIDEAALYRNPAGSADPPPFSLLLDKADHYWEVETPRGWVPCRKSFPDPGCCDPPTNRRWGESVG